MMKNRTLNIYLKGLFLSGIIFLFQQSIIADNSANQIILSGQVTNFEYGNVIHNHPVYITSDVTLHKLGSYSKVVYTDEQGYYHDTISTTDTKGSLLIYTTDHEGRILDTTIHFRFLNRNTNFIIADFSIYLPFKPLDLQARFKYVRKINGDKHKFSFLDQTDFQHIISWYWEFGDGETSNCQNPTHRYADAGLYKVRLTVTARLKGTVQTSSITKQIHLQREEWCHLGGLVFSEYFPIDKGYAYLYLIDSLQNYIAIDTMPFDTLGYYYFYHIPEGKYLVKAEPMKESEHYDQFLPTYYGDFLFWQDASEISLHSTSWEYDIKLVKSPDISAFGGSGSISGNVEFSYEDKSTSGIVADGVHIYLKNDQDDILTCHYSDELGEFIFDLISLNTYWIYPEVTGITTEPFKIELNAITPTVDDITININFGSISYVIPVDNEINNVVGLPFPNPVMENLTIPVNIPNQNIIYEVYDNCGRLIENGMIDSSRDNEIKLNTYFYKRGIYTLKVTSNNESAIRKFVVVK
jgi:PKD repeat protein